MLTFHIESKELFNEKDNTFIMIPETEIRLEHSLISLSRWESKWKKPFLDTKNAERSAEEMVDYICCMSIDKEIDPTIVQSLPASDYIKIKDYIADSRTATTVHDRRAKRGGKSEIYTSELLYYYMIYYGVPFSCEKWHLNRLLMLIKVCGVKGGTTNQEMSMNEIFAQNTALNRARRAGSRSGK